MIIWLASYPKSGNTWVRSIVNQLAFNDIKKNEDVFDGLIKIRKYPTTYDMPKLTKISDLHTDDQKNEVVKISGFGSFKKFSTKARVGRNPKTMQPFPIPSKLKIKFFPSNKVKKMLN